MDTASLNALAVFGNPLEMQFWNQALRACEPGEFGSVSLVDHDLYALEQVKDELSTLHRMSQEGPDDPENRDWIAEMVREKSSQIVGHLGEARNHLVRQFLPAGDRIFVQFEPYGRGSPQWYARKLLDAACNYAEGVGLVPTIEDIRVEGKLLVSAKLAISGRDAFRHFYLESGIHRFEGRDPLNKRDARTHTHQVAISVSGVEGEREDFGVLDPQDVTISYFGSTGPGGQNVNKSQRGVRLVHIPTGLTESCIDQRSRGANHKIAWQRLSEKVNELYLNAARGERIREKREQLSLQSRELKRTRNYDMDVEMIRDERIAGRAFRWGHFLRGDWSDLRHSLNQWAILRSLGVEDLTPSNYFGPDLVSFVAASLV